MLYENQLFKDKIKYDICSSMSKLVFYIIYPFIWLLSKAPFFILYAISDFIYFIIYYLIGYRKELVMKNLHLSFPEKSEKELLRIRRKFYAHFVDIFMEMVKTFTISQDELAKRFKFKNVSVLNDLTKENKSMIVLGSHYGNWEWVISLVAYITNASAFATYTRINNKILEEKIKSTRERFGGFMVLKKNTIKNMIENYNNNNVCIYGLLSDQSPQMSRAYYWSDFMGVRVPIHTGAEMLAKKFDFAVVNMEVSKIKRGYYEVSFELLTEKPNDFPDYEITDIYLKKLEKQIRNDPSCYFWTHNRFKHMGKKETIRKKKE
jgi:KDO2-lipid IV(A) lauroyltransferase